MRINFARLCYNTVMSFLEHSEFSCPYCGAGNSLEVDFTGGRRQKFVVDCEACCSPIVILLHLAGQEIIGLDVRRENE